ncbi:MAG: thioredoxin domain-containing protein [Cellulophaga sp.]
MTRSYSVKISFLSMLLPLLILPFSCADLKSQKKAHKFTNALIEETSPYLLQHAHNPVDWRPWGQEALDEAKKSNKLILVSIGYSSCHWCHVMEKETFENEETAKMMNENFINIKVDREERPDVDQVYMTALQLLKGSGGWPLNVITLPNGKPIYGGTYHTNKQWKEVLAKVNKLYQEDPKKANEYADRLAAGIQEVNLIQPLTDFEVLNTETVINSVVKWKSNWDLELGGDKLTQKFMLPNNVNFLLDYAILSGDEPSKEHVKKTLDKMAMGGVYDQIGGGFYRYSTDKYWKVPHFEKMLYDNAQLLSLYSKAYTVFKSPLYREVVEETIAFLEREMKNTEGGYYAALDADSEGEEGKFYVWKEEELQLALGEDYELFSKYFNVQKKNVWEHGNYVLYNSISDIEFGEENKVASTDLEKLKQKWSDLLLEVRAKRVRPNTDDKILTSWNALLINGFVDAYKAFGNKEYLERAEGVYDFIVAKSYKNKELFHSYKKNSKRIDGFLDDYAFLTNASLNLYGVTMNTKYLEMANTLNNVVLSTFKDEASGMFVYNRSNELISKIIKTNDGVIPSPNAVMAKNLFELGHIYYNVGYVKKSKTMLATVTPLLIENAYSYSNWNSLLLNNAYSYFEIAIVGKNAENKLIELGKYHLPNVLVVASTLESKMSLFEGRYVEEDTYIYVCQDSACKLPVTTVKEAVEQLDNF